MNFKDSFEGFVNDDGDIQNKETELFLSKKSKKEAEKRRAGVMDRVKQNRLEQKEVSQKIYEKNKYPLLNRLLLQRSAKVAFLKEREQGLFF